MGEHVTQKPLPPKALDALRSAQDWARRNLGPRGQAAIESDGTHVLGIIGTAKWTAVGPSHTRHEAFRCFGRGATWDEAKVAAMSRVKARGAP